MLGAAKATVDGGAGTQSARLSVCGAPTLRPPTWPLHRAAGFLPRRVRAFMNDSSPSHGRPPSWIVRGDEARHLLDSSIRRETGCDGLTNKKTTYVFNLTGQPAVKSRWVSTKYSCQSACSSPQASGRDETANRRAGRGGEGRVRGGQWELTLTDRADRTASTGRHRLVSACQLDREQFDAGPDLFRSDSLAWSSFESRLAFRMGSGAARSSPCRHSGAALSPRRRYEARVR